MNEVQWLAFVGLPSALVVLGYIAVRLFEHTHPIPIRAVPETGSTHGMDEPSVEYARLPAKEREAGPKSPRSDATAHGRASDPLIGPHDPAPLPLHPEAEGRP